MTYGYSHIFKISLPLILGMMIQVLVGVTDTAFLGRVGEIELGASAIAGILYLLFYMIAQSFAVGAQIIMARRNGEENYQKIAPVLYQVISFVILFAIISIAFIYRFSGAVLSRTIESSVILSAILTYLLPRCWGLFFSGGKSAFRAFFVAITNTQALLPAAVVLLTANFIFDYWFIFGGFGIEPMGLHGAALASVLAEALSLGYLAGYTLLKVNLRQYGFFKYLFWCNSLFIEIFRLSVWIIFQNLLSWGIWLYFFIEVEKLGADALAISNILRSASSLPFIFANALAMVTSSIVSNLIGAAKDREVLPTAFRILKFGFIPYYASFIIMALFPEVFLRIYTDDAILIKQAVEPFYTMLLTYLLALPGMIYFYAIYGTGKTRTALIIEVLCSVAYIAAIRIIVGILRLELVWCWTSEISYYVILLAASYWYMKRKKWCCEIV